MPENNHSIPVVDEVREIRQELRERGDMVIETQMQLVAMTDNFNRVSSSIDDIRRRGDRQFWLIMGAVLVAPPATVVGSAVASSPAPPPAIQQTMVSPQDLAAYLVTEFGKKGIEIPDMPAPSPRPAPGRQGF